MAQAWDQGELSQCHYSNFQNSIIFWGYVDFLAKIFPILYPPTTKPDNPHCHSWDFAKLCGLLRIYELQCCPPPGFSDLLTALNGGLAGWLLVLLATTTTAVPPCSRAAMLQQPSQTKAHFHLLWLLCWLLPTLVTEHWLPTLAWFKTVYIHLCCLDEPNDF